MRHSLFCAALAAAAGCAHAQTPATSPATAPAPVGAFECGTFLGGGSPDVLIERRSSARAGDEICVRVIDGSRTTRINGRPALRVGDRVMCPEGGPASGRIGVIVGGAASVKIDGVPAATTASRIQGCD